MNEPVHTFEDLARSLYVTWTAWALKVSHSDARRKYASLTTPRWALDLARELYGRLNDPRFPHGPDEVRVVPLRVISADSGAPPLQSTAE